MDRTQSKLFLLYLTVTLEQKAKTPINDAYTAFMMSVLSDAKRGTADYSDPENPTSEPVFNEGDYWRGTHQTPCKNYSDNQDYKLLNGMFTNSLAPFYLRWYRDAIPETEMQKIKDLHDFYVRMGFAKGFIEGADVEIYKEEPKTVVSSEDPTKIVQREHTFEEENTVGMTDERTLPKQERPEKENKDFIIER